MHLFHRRIFLLLFVPFLLLSACVKDEDPPVDEPPVREFETDTIYPREMTRLPGVLYESSGIEVSDPNRIWSHNDSSHSNELFLFDTTGQLVRSLRISNATNMDWEDLAKDPLGRIYINDAGSNANDRQDLVIYRIPNPDTIEGDEVEAERIDFIFPDQPFPPVRTNLNFDIEATIWKDDSIFLFTKDRSIPMTGYTKMYSVPAEPGNHVARLIDSLFVERTPHPGRITAADFNHRTNQLVLLTRTRMLLFSDFPGNRFFDGHIIDYQYNRTLGQTEAVAFVTDRTLYITEEGSVSEPGWLYEVVLP